MTVKVLSSDKSGRLVLQEQEIKMTLKFKRNYRLILLLIAILSFLALAMGNLPIVAYIVN